ncbi:MAG: hypothetical protein IKL55_01035 [Clostridia bacterium]|nr:hypothetical protein [Clostridia bacterium]
MVNKLVKKITLLMLLMIVLLSFSHSASALSLSEMESKINTFKSSASSANINTGEVVGEFADIGSILTMIGTGVMIAVVTYMGIKYLTAGPEAQAKLKTQLIGVVVSGVVIFGAYNIWALVLDIASTF